ncbi:MAG: VWA domain-containing protein, partial [bacterium]|nr:VWA domain-containing protein [bacterium]
MDICLVLDVSGSMAESATDRAHDSHSKLTLVREAAQRLIENLLPTDRVGLVAFSDEARELSRVDTLDEAHRLRITEQIRMLQPTASTNLCGGAMSGIVMLAEAAGACTENRTRRVLLFTDGQANAGVCEQAAVIT